MKYQGIVLFSDLDGTLLDENRRLSKENIEAAAEFIAKGGRFGVATGRMERTTLLKFPELPINTASIFYNGALVFDTRTEETLYRVLMPEGLDSIFQDILNRYPACGVEINAGGKAYVLRYNDIIRIQLEREGIEGVEAEWESIPKGWYKALIVDENVTLRKIKAELDALRRTDVNIMFSEKQLLDLMARNVSKGTTLKRLMDRHSRDWKLVVAVGDNDNDLDMIRSAHIGIAVENATELVRQSAGHIISHHSTPCLPQVLRIIDSCL